MKKTPFEHEGRRLEVRADISASEIKVGVLENSNQVTPIVYRMTIDTIFGGTIFNGTIRGFPSDSIDELIDRAQEDVEEGRVPLWKNSRTAGLTQIHGHAGSIATADLAKE